MKKYVPVNSEGFNSGIKYINIDDEKYKNQ